MALAARGSEQPSTSGRADDDPRPRLAKVLAACGVASRRACEALIDEGRVRVNGQVVNQQGVTVDPTRDKVEVRHLQDIKASAAKPAAPPPLPPPPPPQQQQERAAAKRSTATTGWTVVPVQSFQEVESLYYFAINKPKGYICSSADASGKGKLAIDILAPWTEQWRRENKGKKRLPPRLFTVGRLDVNSTGLLLITNDGQWSNRVIHPSSGVTKEYVVGVEADATRPQLESLAAGTEVAGTFVAPLEVEVLGEPRRLRVVVQEGKKHEVRELVRAAGMNLLTLKRVRIGGFRLPRDLGLGGYKVLTPADLALVTDARAQEAASVSGVVRQQQQQQQQRAAAKQIPHELRGLPSDVLQRLQKL